MKLVVKMGGAWFIVRGRVRRSRIIVDVDI